MEPVLSNARSKVHVAVDTLGQLLARCVIPASAQDRERVAELAAQVQAVTGQSVEVAFVDQGYTGEQPEAAAAEQSMRLEERIRKQPPHRPGTQAR